MVCGAEYALPTAPCRRYTRTGVFAQDTDRREVALLVLARSCGVNARPVFPFFLVCHGVRSLNNSAQLRQHKFADEEYKSCIGEGLSLEPGWRGLPLSCPA